MLRRKFIAIQAYLKKQERCQKIHLTLHLKQLEKEEQKIAKVCRRKESMKIREEINGKEMKEKLTKINKTKSSFFEKVNQIDKLLARLIKKQGRKEKLKQTTKKYKGLQKPMSNYMPIHCTTWKKWVNF